MSENPHVTLCQHMVGLIATHLLDAVGIDEARAFFRSVADNDAFWEVLPAARDGALIGTDEAIRAASRKRGGS